MDKQEKKQRISEYKARKIIGGVYRIYNRPEDKNLVQLGVNLQGCQNRFDFCKRTGSCVDLRLQRAWSRLGCEAFEFEILETLDQKEAQTQAEFLEELELLLKLWLEKWEPEQLY